MHLSRAALLRSGVATMASVGYPKFALAQTLGIRVGCGLIESQAQAYYARAQGFFKKAGLDVDILVSQNGATTAAAVIGGTLDVGVTSTLNLAQAVERGLPFVTFAPGSVHDDHYPDNAILVLPTSPIKTAKDIVGKTVAVSTARGMDQLVVSATVARAGGDVSAVKFLEMPPTTMLAALQAGRVDVISVEPPQLLPALPFTRNLGDGGKAVGLFYVQTTWFTTKEWLAKNTEAARRFREAIAAAGRWAMANDTAAAAILRESIKVEVPRATERFATRLERSDYQGLLDTLAHFKFINPINASEFVVQV